MLVFSLPGQSTATLLLLLILGQLTGGSQPPGLPGQGGGNGGCGVGRVNAEISTPWRKHYRMHVCCHLHIEIYPKGPSFGKFCFLLYLPIEGRKLFIIKK